MPNSANNWQENEIFVSRIILSVLITALYSVAWGDLGQNLWGYLALASSSLRTEWIFWFRSFDFSSKNHRYAEFLIKMGRFHEGSRVTAAPIKVVRMCVPPSVNLFFFLFFFGNWGEGSSAGSRLEAKGVSCLWSGGGSKADMSWVRCCATGKKKKSQRCAVFAFSVHMLLNK